MPGELIDEHHERRDSRLAARMLSLGVVDEQTVERLLRKAYDLAEKASKRGNTRNYVAAMSVPIAVARLELEAAKVSYLMTAGDDELPEGLREIRDENFFGNRERINARLDTEADPES